MGEFLTSTKDQKLALSSIHGRGRFFVSSRRRHTRFDCDWSSDVCSSDLCSIAPGLEEATVCRVLEDVGVDRGTYLAALLALEQQLQQAELAIDGRRSADGASAYLAYFLRSEERRVGKECISRRAPDCHKN